MPPLTATTRTAQIALAPLAVAMMINAVRPQQPTTAVPTSRALAEKQAARTFAAEYNRLAQAMLKLPTSQRAAFIDKAPEHFRASLIMKSIESLIVSRKPAKQQYNNRYGRKQNVAKPIVTVRSDSDWNAFPPYPNKQPQSYRALSSMGVMEYVAPAEPMLPVSKNAKPLNAERYINPVMQSNMLVPAGSAPVVATEAPEQRIGDEKVLADIARRSAAKMERYGAEWNKKAHALPQTMPTISAEKSIKLSNTNATVNSGRGSI